MKKIPGKLFCSEASMLGDLDDTFDSLLLPLFLSLFPTTIILITLITFIIINNK